MNNLALYQIADRYRALETLADSADIPPEVIRDTLDAIGGELEEKAIAVAHFILNLEAAADNIDRAADAMSQRAERMRQRATSVRQYLLFHLQATKHPKIWSPYFTIAVRNNPPSVAVEDESAVPDEYKVIPSTPAPVVDRFRVREALKAGGVVPGCRLESKQRLEIKA